MTWRETLARETYQAHHKSVVSVVTSIYSTGRQGSRLEGIANGTGFIVRSGGGQDTVIMTADHVLRQIEPRQRHILNIGIPGEKKKFLGEILHRDSGRDMAIIRLRDTSTRTFEAMEFSDSLPVATREIGSKVAMLAYYYVTGTPECPGSSPGVICGPDRVYPTSPGVEYIRTDMPGSPGNSGAPLIFNGKVIGLVVSLSVQVTLAISTDCIKDSLIEGMVSTSAVRALLARTSAQGSTTQAITIKDILQEL